jgi:hypothetical protein
MLKTATWMTNDFLLLGRSGFRLGSSKLMSSLSTVINGLRIRLNDD